MGGLLAWTGLALILAVPTFFTLDVKVGAAVFIAGVLVMWYDFLKARK